MVKWCTRERALIVPTFIAIMSARIKKTESLIILQSPFYNNKCTSVVFMPYNMNRVLVHVMLNITMSNNFPWPFKRRSKGDFNPFQRSHKISILKRVEFINVKYLCTCTCAFTVKISIGKQEYLMNIQVAYWSTILTFLPFVI